MILLNGNEIKFEKFPNGETRIDNLEVDYFTIGSGIQKISFKYEDDSDLIKLLLIKNHLDNLKLKSNLIIYYMPYSRMDRSENGSVFTLKYISEFINGLQFEQVEIIEPHSDVSTALINNSKANYINFKLLPMVENEIEFEKDVDFLFFPDAGASKRYTSLKRYNQLLGHKQRDFNTGEIKSLEVVGLQNNLDIKNTKIIIVDDLSSYGGTFLHSGNKLKELGFSEIYLLVTHCEESILKGKLLDDESPIKKIFTTDSILNSEHKKIKKYRIEEMF